MKNKRKLGEGCRKKCMLQGGEGEVRPDGDGGVHHSLSVGGE